MRTAGTQPSRSVRAAVAALLAAAILVVLAPDHDAGATDKLPPSTVPVVDVTVRFSPQLDVAGRRGVVRAAGGTVSDVRRAGALDARVPSTAVAPLRSALGVVSVARATS